MNTNLKALVDSMTALVATIGKKQGVEDLDKAVLLDLGKFMMYLSASDGVIEPEEANSIGAYIGMEFTPESLNKFLVDNNIYSSSFEHSVPESLKTLVEVDNKLRAAGANPDEDASEILLAIYKGLGVELIVSDGDVDTSEETDFGIYVSTLDKYLDNNLVSRNKNKAAKVGVAAPKKS